ncbi:MAG TPA: ABC transporter ATP-binding protein [Holophagaceae bacterium]|jgi:peptide/nickel transport system ATP-binding protein|nr:ABC transporter ATP-binding protein [Holophagaceae bacterium]
MTLQIRNLRLERQDGAHLLGPLDLDLAPGGRLGLVGESGSGKSLLVQALFGVLPKGVAQTGGWITAFGTRLDRPGPERDRIRGARLAWVPQDPLQALNPFMTVAEQLALLPGVHRKERKATAVARLTPLLERLRLPSDKAFLKRFSHELSGGQRQRLCLAMALSCDPELLVLDEPTTALDPGVQAEFLELIREIQAERSFGFLWITHDLGVVASLCDRILVLYGGEPMEAGPAARLLKNPTHPYTVRLLSAARREPSTEGGFLSSPGERPAGCPFAPRCDRALPSCAAWAPWQGGADDGFRCEHPLP